MLQSNSPVLTGVVGRFSCSRHFSLTRIGSHHPRGPTSPLVSCVSITASMFISDHWRGALSNAEERENQNLQPTRLRHECSAAMVAEERDNAKISGLHTGGITHR